MVGNIAIQFSIDVSDLSKAVYILVFIPNVGWFLFNGLDCYLPTFCGPGGVTILQSVLTSS